MSSTESIRYQPRSAAGRMPLRSWLAVLAVALGTFLVVTVENLPMGLLTSIGAGLGITDGQVGLMVTVSGLVAAVTAPILPVLIRRLDRRLVLTGLILLMALANVVTALTPSYGVLLVARFVVGIAIGGFWALAAGLAVRLVPDSHVARATSVIFFGAMAANVLGVPLGTMIGGLTDWRFSFMSLAVVTLALAIALFVLLPRIPADQPVSLRTLAQQLRTPSVRVGVIATFLLVSGQYGAFTFVSPILQTIPRVSAQAIAPLLLAYGIAGIVGNFIAGAAAGRNVRTTIIAVSIALATILAIFPFVGGNQFIGMTLFILWGAAFGGLPVSVQTWIIKAAPNNIEAATGLNTSMFNLAIASGALVGSIIVDAVAVRGVLWIAAALVSLTSVAVWRTRGPRCT